SRCRTVLLVHTMMLDESVGFTATNGSNSLFNLPWIDRKRRPILSSSPRPCQPVGSTLASVSSSGRMSTHVVLLGAGFGGRELASRLSESVADEARVTLIDQNDSFSFGFSKLDVLLGRKTASDIRLPYSEIDKDGVEFRQERVTAIDPETRTVTTEQGSYE